MINFSSIAPADSEACLPGPSSDIPVSSPVVDQFAHYVENLEEASSTPEEHADICSASIVDQPDESWKKLAALPKYMLIYILVIWAKY